ncbi:hypothetical protein [Nonlabens antarcticus]|uniref:hypothetical protein n=1 Tax=Nonlabens antarcticus TaxID=392714 RepID=UPI001891E9B9|nr:hypothetical protein [Nonlabens antarcticus]
MYRKIHRAICVKYVINCHRTLAKAISKAYDNPFDNMTVSIIQVDNASSITVVLHNQMQLE